MYVWICREGERQCEWNQLCMYRILQMNTNELSANADTLFYVYAYIDCQCGCQ